MGSQVALMQPEYDVLDSILEEVHVECVMLDGSDTKYLKRIFNGVLDKFIKIMRLVDPMFDQVFNRIGYTGSFYDGLRVGEATEYDLNLILIPEEELELVHLKKPGFVQIKVPKNCGHPVRDWKVKHLLSPKRVKEWLKNVTLEAMNVTRGRVNGHKIRLEEHGPAITLIIRPKGKRGREISMDLVPVLEFCSVTQWPNIPRKSKKLLNGSHEDPWFVVPKGDDCWRMSFPNQERWIIHDLCFFKHILRLLKRVRDQLGIHKVVSYHVKTLFMWELEVSDHNIWSDLSKGRLFMHMLLRLRSALENKCLPFYWNKNDNLIEHLDDNYVRNRLKKLNNFIRKIDYQIYDQDYVEDYIWDVLTTEVRSDHSNLLVSPCKF